jgi:hypothetical protein
MQHSSSRQQTELSRGVWEVKLHVLTCVPVASGSELQASATLTLTPSQTAAKTGHRFKTPRAFTVLLFDTLN